MTSNVKVGDAIPPFFLKDHEGYDVAEEDIIGCPVVIFFYPKDSSPGCTEEACAFRDHMDAFDKQQVLLIGVSPDNMLSHKKFIMDNKLEFSLLSDEKKDMARMYGVLDEKGNIIRTTLLINSQGIIQWMEKPVNVQGHIERVLKAIEEHCKDEVINVDNDSVLSYEELLREKLKERREKKKSE